MAVRNDLSETIRRIARFFYWFPKSLTTSRRRTLKFVWKSPDCRYTCHAHCQDLVHLGCRQNGKLMDCLPPHDTVDPFYSSGQLFYMDAVSWIKEAQRWMRPRSRAEEGAIALYGYLCSCRAVESAASHPEPSQKPSKAAKHTGQLL